MLDPIPDSRIREEVAARIEVDPCAVRAMQTGSSHGCAIWVAVAAAFLCGMAAGAAWFS